MNIFTENKMGEKEYVTDTWSDLINRLGWKFEGLTKDGKVIMTRGGYINCFWAEYEVGE